MLFRCFDIGGNRCRIVSNDAALIGRVTRSLEAFACAGGDAFADIHILSSDGWPPPISIPETARCVYSGEKSVVFLYKNLWLIDFHGMARVAVDTEEAISWGFVKPCCLEEESWLSDALLQPVYEFLRRRGLYLLHSGAVAAGGRGVLIAGNSGVGKTTAALHLASAGFNFLCDDGCFVRASGPGFEVLSFPQRVTVYAANVADLPEFEFLQGGGRSGGRKEGFKVEEVYPHSIVNSAELKAIVFPSWEPDGESQMEVMSQRRAVTEMLPLTLASLAMDTARSHFEFTVGLLEKIPVFRLRLGSDKGKWSEIVRKLLQ